MFTTAQVTSSTVPDPTQARQYFSAIALPQGYQIPQVEIPQVLGVQVPAPGDIVLVWAHGAFGAKYISTLVTPDNSASRLNLLVPGSNTQASGSRDITGTSSPAMPCMEAGEVQVGHTSGSSLFFNNVGGIHLAAATVSEELVLENNSATLHGGSLNVYANSSIPGTHGALYIDHFNNVSLGTINPQTKILVNGVHSDILGNVKISNLLGSVSINPVGEVTINAATAVTVNSLSATIRAASVTLGEGIGQKLATEHFVETLYDAHTHTSATPGNPTSPPLIPAALDPLATTVITSAS